MNASIFAQQIGRRFRPVSAELFGAYAKNLSRLTGDGLARSRETLAKIYRYSGAYELQKVMEQPGTPGPFDDDIPTDEFNTEELREAIEDRNARAMHLIVEANKEWYDNGAPRPTMLQLYMLQLFSRPKVHFAAFRDLAIPKKTSAERRQEREKYLNRELRTEAMVKVSKIAKSNNANEKFEMVIRPLTEQKENRKTPVVVVTRKRPKRIYSLNNAQVD